MPSEVRIGTRTTTASGLISTSGSGPNLSAAAMTGSVSAAACVSEEAVKTARGPEPVTRQLVTPFAR
jgi:hypothetical protein